MIRPQIAASKRPLLPLAVLAIVSLYLCYSLWRELEVGIGSTTKSDGSSPAWCYNDDERSLATTFGTVLDVLDQAPIRKKEQQAILRGKYAQEPEPRVHMVAQGALMGEDSSSDQENNKGSERPVTALRALIDAVDVMQSKYFEVFDGTWPDAIDWTAAVLGTHVSTVMRSLSSASTQSSGAGGKVEVNRCYEQERENLINRYFTQLSTFYFGENAFSLRNQAFDDMLWVVLGWLENIKFISEQDELFRTYSRERPNHDWYGTQFIKSAAHRARIFYDLASQGWDTSLCGGGMTWNPYLTPYKNAITNELYVSASIAMYLYFPGDPNSSPFSANESDVTDQRLKPHDPTFLKNAIDAYKWLRASNMTNAAGLYVDGFHISGWHKDKNGTKYPGSAKCDIRNEKVFTYNQGVLLTGVRGLWAATGARSYLEDGHNLIRSTISATGWGSHDRKWHGLGRAGILEDTCDSIGGCSQDGQTFKGIFFIHFTEFCRDLHEVPHPPYESEDMQDLWSWHHAQCSHYSRWVIHNARAAYSTRNSRGEFGTWWGVHYGTEIDQPEAEGIDYRNDGVPNDRLWQLNGTNSGLHGMSVNPASKPFHEAFSSDPNDRGRGRTVETQSGGVAVMRALWELVDRRSNY